MARHALGKQGGGTPVLNIDHYLDVLLRKPAAVRHARVVNALREEVRAYRDAFLAHHSDAYRALVDILLLCRRYTHEAVLDGIKRARAEQWAARAAQPTAGRGRERCPCLRPVAGADRGHVAAVADPAAGVRGGSSITRRWLGRVAARGVSRVTSYTLRRS